MVVLFVCVREREIQIKLVIGFSYSSIGMEYHIETSSQAIPAYTITYSTKTTK